MDVQQAIEEYNKRLKNVNDLIELNIFKTPSDIKEAKAIAQCYQDFINMLNKLK